MNKLTTKAGEVRATGPANLGKVLRDYQVGDVDALERLRAKNVLYVAPTGSGKTVVFVRCVNLAVARGERVLILVNRWTILEQTYRKLLDDGLDEASVGVIWQKDSRTNPKAPVQLASVDTYVRRYWPDFDRIVIDEAQHATSPKYMQVLDAYPGVPRLGATATPCRLDGKPLDVAFDVMHVSADPLTLIEAGHLARPEVWTWDAGVDLKGIRTKGGDYEVESLGKRMSKRATVGGVATHWKRHANGYRTVCYAASVRHAGVIARALSRAAITNESIFGTTPIEVREQVLARLQSRRTKVVITCDVIGEGWDMPDLECVIEACPTKSLAKWLQHCGRAMRPSKRTPVILDHAGNGVRLGVLPHFPILWDLHEGFMGRQGGRTVVVDSDGRVGRGDPKHINGQLVHAGTATEAAQWTEERIATFIDRYAKVQPLSQKQRLRLRKRWTRTP